MTLASKIIFGELHSFPDSKSIWGPCGPHVGHLGCPSGAHLGCPYGAHMGPYGPHLAHMGPIYHLHRMGCMGPIWAKWVLRGFYTGYARSAPYFPHIAHMGPRSSPHTPNAAHTGTIMAKCRKSGFLVVYGLLIKNIFFCRWNTCKNWHVYKITHTIG